MPSYYRPGDQPVPGYKLLQRLGQGGFGEVWKASAPGGAQVAFKVISLEEKHGFKEFRAVRMIKNIHYPLLVQISAFWIRDGAGNLVDPGNSSDSSIMSSKPTELLIAMTLGDKSLYDRLRECQRAGESGIPPDELLGYMHEAARAIDYLNGRNHDTGSGPVALQHCDIKPQNLLLQGGAVLLCDFGLVRALGVDQRNTTNNPNTLAYTPPELQSGPDPSSSSDQYSLAITYFELRTGHLPFDSFSLAAILQAHLNGRLNLSRVPASEQAVLRRATDVDPSRRYPNCQELVRELRRALKKSTTMDIHVPDSPGKQIVPGYKLVKEIGKGGYGTVWEAHAPGGIEVAIKVIRGLRGSAGKQEFKALRLIQRFRHAHLLTLLAYWLLDEGDELIPEEDWDKPDSPDPAALAIVTELADRSLLDRLRECYTEGLPGIPPQELVGYLDQAAQAIDYLNWEASIQHRDIKPENLLLIGRGIRVADFGLAKLVEGTSAIVQPQSSGMTPPYAAPELWEGKVTTWSDQYALALTYFKLRTGRMPFAPNLPAAQIMLVHAEGNLDLSLLDAPERQVITQATAVVPTDRYPKCQDMVQALAEALRGPARTVGLTGAESAGERTLTHAQREADAGSGSGSRSSGPRRLTAGGNLATAPPEGRAQPPGDAAAGPETPRPEPSDAQKPTLPLDEAAAAAQARAQRQAGVSANLTDHLTPTILPHDSAPDGAAHDLGQNGLPDEGVRTPPPTADLERRIAVIRAKIRQGEWARACALIDELAIPEPTRSELRSEARTAGLAAGEAALARGDNRTALAVALNLLGRFHGDADGLQLRRRGVKGIEAEEIRDKINRREWRKACSLIDKLKIAEPARGEWRAEIRLAWLQEGTESLRKREYWRVEALCAEILKQFLNDPDVLALWGKAHRGKFRRRAVLGVSGFVGAALLVAAVLGIRSWLDKPAKSGGQEGIHASKAREEHLTQIQTLIQEQKFSSALDQIGTEPNLNEDDRYDLKHKALEAWRKEAQDLLDAKKYEQARVTSLEILDRFEKDGSAEKIRAGAFDGEITQKVEGFIQQADWLQAAETLDAARSRLGKRCKDDLAKRLVAQADEAAKQALQEKDKDKAQKICNAVLDQNFPSESLEELRRQCTAPPAEEAAQNALIKADQALEDRVDEAIGLYKEVRRLPDINQDLRDRAKWGLARAYLRASQFENLKKELEGLKPRSIPGWSKAESLQGLQSILIILSDSSWPMNPESLKLAGPDKPDDRALLKLLIQISNEPQLTALPETDWSWEQLQVKTVRNRATQLLGEQPACTQASSVNIVQTENRFRWLKEALEFFAVTKAPQPIPLRYNLAQAYFGKAQPDAKAALTLTEELLQELRQPKLPAAAYSTLMLNLRAREALAITDQTTFDRLQEARALPMGTKDIALRDKYERVLAPGLKLGLKLASEAKEPGVCKNVLEQTDEFCQSIQAALDTPTGKSSLPEAAAEIRKYYRTAMQLPPIQARYLLGYLRMRLTDSESLDLKALAEEYRRVPNPEKSPEVAAVVGHVELLELLKEESDQPVPSAEARRQWIEVMNTLKQALGSTSSIPPETKVPVLLDFTIGYARLNKLAEAAKDTDGKARWKKELGALTQIKDPSNALTERIIWSFPASVCTALAESLEEAATLRGQERRVQDALFACNKVLSFGKEFRSPRILLCRARCACGLKIQHSADRPDLAEVLKDLQEVVRLAPGSQQKSEAWYWQAKILDEQGKGQSRNSALKEAVRLGESSGGRFLIDAREELSTHLQSAIAAYLSDGESLLEKPAEAGQKFDRAFDLTKEIVSLGTADSKTKAGGWLKSAADAALRSAEGHRKTEQLMDYLPILQTIATSLDDFEDTPEAARARGWGFKSEVARLRGRMEEYQNEPAKALRIYRAGLPSESRNWESYHFSLARDYLDCLQLEVGKLELTRNIAALGRYVREADRAFELASNEIDKVDALFMASVIRYYAAIAISHGGSMEDGMEWLNQAKSKLESLISNSPKHKNTEYHRCFYGKVVIDILNNDKERADRSALRDKARRWLIEATELPQKRINDEIKLLITRLQEIAD